MKLTEVNGDLFAAPKDNALAHCVAADLRMGKGIAVQFRNIFGQLAHLKAQNVQPGGAAVLKDIKSDRFVYYLVTKSFSYQKPTYQLLSSSLEAMRTHMLSHNVQNLAIPKIGCGLDGLQWPKVKDVINDVFQNDNVQIVVYNFAPK